MATNVAKGAAQLTLDGEKFTAGIQKAANTAKSGADKISKAGKDAGGGWKDSFAGNALAEGMFKAFDFVYGRIEEMKGKIEEGKLILPPELETSVHGAYAAFEKISGTIDEFIANMLSALAPTITMIADAFDQWAPQIFPIFAQLASWIEQAVSLLIPIIDLVFEIKDVIVDWLTEWLEYLFGVQDGWISFQDVVIGVLRAVGVGGAYAFDTIRAGIGLVLAGAGQLVKGFGYVVDGFSRLVGLAKKLPDNVRPEWVDSFADALDSTQNKIKQAGRDLTDYGLDMVNSFGKSADYINRKLDAYANKAEQLRAKANADVQAAGLFQKKLQDKGGKDDVQTIIQGSKEDYQIRAKFMNEGLVNKGKEELAEAKKQTAELKGIRAAVSRLNQEYETI